MGSWYRLCGAPTFVFGLLLLTSRAGATLVVGSEALGSQLAGGSVTVTFASGFEGTASITAGAGDSGIASLLGYFGFSVTGNTFYPTTWSLRNDTSGDMIVGVLFDLTGSISLFDTGPVAPADCGTPPTYSCGTFDSRTGVPSGVTFSGPAITSVGSGELEPWPDSGNTGDMYLRERLNWGNNDFTAGQTALWYDDTDYWTVPEPAAIFLVGGGLIAVFSWRRRSWRA